MKKSCQLNDLFPAENLAELIKHIENGSISGKIAKSVFQEMLVTGASPQKIIQDKNLVQISDESQIKEMVLEVLSENQESVDSFKAGKDRAMGFLVGQVMKKSKGKANPPLVNKVLMQELKK